MIDNTNTFKPGVTLDIIVVGAGMSGLGTAISSALSGHRVTVFEAAKELHEVGAGIQVTPNASRILQSWQLPDSFWASAAEPTTHTIHRYADGSVLAHEATFNRDMRARYGAPFLNLHRVDLQQGLYARALALGVKFRLGHRVRNIDFGDDASRFLFEPCGGPIYSRPMPTLPGLPSSAAAPGSRPSIMTDDGSTFEADLIVAADGLWSACRAAFLGAARDTPRPTGDLAYRVVLTLDDLAGEPDLQRWVSNPTVHFWIGPNAHAVGYSLRAGTMYNIVLLVPDDLPEGVRRKRGSVEEMKALFRGWDPILGRFLERVKEVDKWKLMHRSELPHWVNEQGNFAFVGDACHPMLPYLAQGANSALEDGAVLGMLLGHLETKEQLPQALATYEKLRKARDDAIARETFKQRDDFHMPDGPEQQARDQLMLSQLGRIPEGAFPSRWTCPKVQPWLYGYDAEREVEVAMRDEPFV